MIDDSKYSFWKQLSCLTVEFYTVRNFNIYFWQSFWHFQVIICVLYSSQHNWVSRRADLGPKTIEQIHKEAKLEEQEEQRKVHQQLLSKDNKRRPGEKWKWDFSYRLILFTAYSVLWVSFMFSLADVATVLCSNRSFSMLQGCRERRHGALCLWPRTAEQ